MRNLTANLHLFRIFTNPDKKIEYIRLKDKYENEAQYLIFGATAELTKKQKTVHLKSGWNLFSLPLKPENSVAENVFSCLPSFPTVYGWEDGYESVDAGDNLEVGQGYWVYVEESENVTVTGTPVENLTLSLSQGWNLAGLPSGVLPQTPGNIFGQVPTIYGWTEHGYNPMDAEENFKPGQGYWIYTKSQISKELKGEVARITVTSVNTPSEVNTGQTATVSAVVTNTGGQEGTKTIDFVVDGETMDSQDVTVGPGTTITVTFQITKDEKGTYNLNIGGVAATLTVLAPAEFEVSNLEISPRKSEPGKAVTISVNVQNVGKVKGTHKLELKVNGNVENSQTIELTGGESTTVSFKIRRENPKRYSVGVEELSDNFEVLEPAKFETSNFRVSPEEPVAGEEFTASVDVKNGGELGGTFKAVWKVGGDVDDTQEVTVSPGETRAVTFSMVWKEAGAYNVSLSGMSKPLTVLAPAEFEVSNLQVSPKEAEPGETVTVTVDVKNVGRIKGTHKLKLKVENTTEKTKKITLRGGENTAVSFSITKENSRFYMIKIEKLSSSFKVLEPAPAKLKIDKLDIKPEEVFRGEGVDVFVRVSNTGGKRGTKNLSLKLNGGLIKSKSITLHPGEKENVVFSLGTSYKSPGRYILGINELSVSESFKVKAEINPNLNPRPSGILLEENFEGSVKGSIHDYHGKIKYVEGKSGSGIIDVYTDNIRALLLKYSNENGKYVHPNSGTVTS
ncbi:hypothetical protein AKJ66_00165 [candidate division MSBL1 archaeon SCGC-AAA259E22]|uniref:CARDB domain-containing protein n=1 Tax=candidate division MSBL1 archaeon SCGC-AAA259E22 TaxID=1698265 RepID=A0A133UIL3_9EURY|nr:hypothetical protein AKJ66_00165 [candidate division MSBL1 archaeon SCGC-AAA259E22]